jgi:outer membrane protein OmpA-like peptidoglycan-associated protein
MLCQCRHLILLYPLLLIPFLSRSQQRPQDTLILHFRLDSYQIQPADRARLTSLKSAGADLVLITGYTDKTGTLAYNQRLSRQRANAAARLLKSGRPQTSGLQQTSGRPQTSGQPPTIGGGVAPTPERTDSDNRRVEIVYYYIPPATTDTRPVPQYDTVTRRTPAAATGKTSRPNDSIIVVKSTPANSTSADSAQPEAVLTLHHINFIVDTPIPTDSTQRILPQFITELQQFRDHHLEIDGYVNSFSPMRGPKDPLFILSVRRAKFIYDYLIDAGFDPAKLSYKGMGNATPVNPHPITKEEMNANMRVEIKVF